MAIAAATAVLAAACSDPSSVGVASADGEVALGPTVTVQVAEVRDALPLPTSPPLPTVPTTSPPPDPVTILAVGNLGRCTAQNAALSEALIVDEGLIIAAGDLLASNEVPADNCFALESELDRIHGVPGDQDTDVAFDALIEQSPTNPEAGGWFVTTIGGWQLIGLNSRCEEAGGCDVGSAQYQWLDRILSEHSTECRAVVWHDARFTSASGEEDATDMGALLGRLDGAGTDLVITGSASNYERLGPLRPSGARAEEGEPGTMHFNIGGGSSAGFERELQPGSRVRKDAFTGYVRFILGPEGYTWEFVATSEGESEPDAGTGSC